MIPSMKRAFSLSLPAWSLALAAAAACAGCRLGHSNAPRYETAAVSRGDLSQHVTATGTLSAVVSVDVGSQVSGKIVMLDADFNSRVKKGQIVAEIDTAVYEAALKQAEGNLASARANAVLMRQNLARKRVLLPLHAATQADLDAAVANLDQALATIDVDEAALESAQANLGYCKITSPIDGVVISRKVDLGQTVAAAMTTPVLFTIAQDLSKMNISATVSEADIGQVRDGQPVDFTVDAFPDDVFHGTVTEVRKAPTTTSNVVTYETIIAVDNPGERLFPGMTADVSILVAERRHVLKIPNAALRYTPPETAQFDLPAAPSTGPAAEGPSPPRLERNQRIAYMLSADGARLRPVVLRTGITDSACTEVLGGLSDDARVVIANLSGAGSGASGGPPPPGP